LPGFAPAGELVVWRIPKGATFVVEAKGPNNGRALRDPPCTLTPRPLTSEWTDADYGRAAQLAALGQGLPVVESVRPLGRAAGVGHWKMNISGIPLKECGTIHSV